MSEIADTGKHLPKAIGNFFSKIWQIIKRRKKLFIVLTSLIVVAAVTLVLLLNIFGGTEATGISIPDTTLLTRMDLELVVTGTGTLQSADVHEVTTSLSYKVVEVNVKEGDAVQKGDVLCTLDTSDLDETIADVRKDIATAEEEDAELLDDLSSTVSAATSQRSTNWTNNDAAVTAAQNAVTAAKNTLTTKTTSLNSAVSELENKIKGCLNLVGGAYPTHNGAYIYTLIRSNDDVDYYYDINNTWFNTGDAQGVKTAISVYLTRYSAAKKEYEEAQSAVTSAQNTYNNAVSTRDNQYANDTTSIDNAQSNYDTQAKKDSAENLRKQLKEYLSEKKECTIVASASGTVTEVAAEVGKSAGGGSGSATSNATASLFTIENMQKLEVPVSVAEYDAIGLSSGLLATVTSDAVSDKEWSGKVTSVSPKASSGYFTLMVEITSDVDELTAGMSAEVDIITESRKDVYAVPIDAVVTNAEGQTVVYALEMGMSDANGMGNTDFSGSMPARSMANGSGETQTDLSQQRVEIVVETGLETDYYVEISGDELRDGMMILNDPNGNNVQRQAQTQSTSGQETTNYVVGIGDMTGGGGQMPTGGGGAPGAPG